VEPHVGGLVTVLSVVLSFARLGRPFFARHAARGCLPVKVKVRRATTLVGTVVAAVIGGD
jgi:hypothetical protein